MSPGLPPRATSGSQFHRFGDTAHAVVLDADAKEVSERHAGDVWIAIASSQVSLLFMDQNGGNTSRFTTTAGASNPRVGILVDGDLIHQIPVVGWISKGAFVDVDWSEMYDGMR